MNNNNLIQLIKFLEDYEFEFIRGYWVSCKLQDKKMTNEEVVENFKYLNNHE